MADQNLTIRIGAVITGVKEALLSIKASLTGVSGAAAKAEAAFLMLNKVLLSSVIGLIVVALAKLVQVFKDNEKAVKKLQPLMIGLERIGGGIYRAFEPLLDIFIELATKAMPYLTKGVGIVYSALYGLFTLVKTGGIGIGNILKGIFTLDGDAISKGYAQLKSSVFVAVDASLKAFDRYELGLTDLTKTEKKLLKKAAKDREKEQREAEQVLRDSLEGRKKLLESELLSVGRLSDRYLELKRAIAEVSTQLDSIGQKGGNQERQQALQNTLKDIEEDFRNLRFGEGKIDMSLLFTADQTRLSELATDAATDFSTKFREVLKTAGQVSGNITLVPSEAVMNSIIQMDALKTKINDVTTAFGQVMAPVIDTVFGALENGSSIFKAIGQSLKALVVQMGLAIVKAAALAAILALIPGAKEFFAVTGGAGGGGGFLDIFSQIFKFGKTAAPNFGGVSGGGLSGQVVFVQRGTDLVGVLQRSNNRINRVG